MKKYIIDGQEYIVKTSLKKEYPYLFARISNIVTPVGVFARVTDYEYRKSAPIYTEKEKDIFDPQRTGQGEDHDGGIMDRKQWKNGIYDYYAFWNAVDTGKIIEPIS